jgi:hypothetical protein
LFDVASGLPALKQGTYAALHHLRAVRENDKYFFSDRLDLHKSAAFIRGGAFVQDTKNRALPQNERQE